MEEYKKQFEKFQQSGQEKIRLEIALQEYTERDGLPEKMWEEYGSYLKKRSRPAAEKLIADGNISGLEKLKEAEILKESYIDIYLEKARETGQTEVSAWLLGMKRREDSKEEKGSAGGTVSSGARFGERILRLVRSRLQIKLPEFSAAFGNFEFQPFSGILGFGTDGGRVYYDDEILADKFLSDEEELLRDYFHMVLHGLYLHVPAAAKREETVWNAACDWEAEYLAQTDFRFLFEREQPQEKQRWFHLLETICRPVQAEALYGWLLSHPQECTEIGRVFHRDDHAMWRKTAEKEKACGKEGQHGTSAAVSRQTAEAARWNRIRSQIHLCTQEQRRRQGTKSGSLSYEVELKKHKVYDYRKFLKRYAVFREELQIDQDNFDYLPYIYSRQHYENLVLLEPLESAEVHKLEELVIAIDTSGSCSGKVVQRFLEETYQILSCQENFFKRIHVVLIQCDSMIQGCAEIHSQAEWEAYIKNLKVQGFGGTDFRPVFSLVEKMRQKGRLRNLKGLLYFTDGDGIYPQKPPDYETAFVFLNRQYEKQKIPHWAVKLNLNLTV